MPSEYAQPQIEILPDAQGVAVRSAAWIAEQIAATEDVCRISLAGGNTPRALYSELAKAKFRDRIDWRRVELFWGDERFVPRDDPRSNYRMVRETLLAHAPVLIDHVHPVVTDGDPDTAARAYEAALQRAYGGDLLSPGKPLFAIVLLGLGGDGHTASLFPADSDVLEERVRWSVPVYSRAEPRVTLTYPPLQSSRATAFLVTGEEKSEAVRRVLAGDSSLPAARLHSQGRVAWFLDSAAARCLGTCDG